MYFFDLEDYIGTFSGQINIWEDYSIINGGIIGGSKGIFQADFEDNRTTFRATRDAYIKAVASYFEKTIDIVNYGLKPEIENLYYTDFWDEVINNIKVECKLFNSVYASEVRYKNQVAYGSFSGTYQQWFDALTIPANTTYACDLYVTWYPTPTILTGQSVTDTVNRPTPTGIISVPFFIDYGDGKYTDELFENYNNSIRNLINITKKLMILIDGDTFEDFIP